MPNGIGTLLNSFVGHEGQIYMGAFDPKDDNTIATAGADHSVGIWDVNTGNLKRRISHHAKVLALAFSADGQSIATACEDGTVRIWSTTTGAWKGPILHHENAVTRVAFLPAVPGEQQGQQVLTASNDGTARIWTMPMAIGGTPDELLRKFKVETGMAPVAHLSADSIDLIRSGEGLLRILGPKEWDQLRNSQ